MQHHKMFCRISAPRISCESEIFLKSETFCISCALPYCCQAAAESCCEGKAPQLISPSWDQGETLPCQAKNGKVGKAETRTLGWTLNQKEQSAMCLCKNPWGVFLEQSFPWSHKIHACASTCGACPSMCARKCCMFFLEIFGAGGCRSDIHVPFPRCNPSAVSFWLCSAKDYTWGMAVGTLINSCFQVTATHPLYQFPRVLLSMCRKLRAREKSIHFTIVGEKILHAE